MSEKDVLLQIYRQLNEVLTVCQDLTHRVQVLEAMVKADPHLSGTYKNLLRTEKKLEASQAALSQLAALQRAILDL